MTLPVFETLRLTLRSITEHDAEGLHEAYGDADGGGQRHDGPIDQRERSGEHGRLLGQ